MRKPQSNRTTVTITKDNRPRLDLLALVFLREKGLITTPSVQDTLLLAIEEALLRRGYDIRNQREPSEAIRKLLEADRQPVESA